MSCPDQATLGQNLTFTLQAYDTDGSPVDTDALPTYKIYEEETGTEILSGTMAKLDDADTTGFYSEQVAVNSTNGFELWKSYTIRYAAAISTTPVAKVDSFIVAFTQVVPTATTGALSSIANFKSYIGKTDSDDDTLLTALLARATSAIEEYCDRTLVSTTGREFYDGTGDFELYANNYPITDITLLSVGRAAVLKINNGNSDAWNAHVTIGATSMVVTVQGGTNDGSDTLTLASYTITTLAAAIAALGKGWSATVQTNDFGVWEAVELIPCLALRCFDNVYAYAECPAEPETDFKFEQNTGRLYLGTGFPRGRQNVTLRYTYGYATTPADLEQITIDLMNLYWRGRKTDFTLKAERLADHWKTMAEGGHDIPDHFKKRLAPYKKFRITI